MAIVLLAIALAVTGAFLVAPNLVGLVGLALSWVGGIVLAGLANWDSTERLVGRLLSHLDWAGSAVKRLSIAAEMEGTINAARGDIASELGGVMVHPAKVRFVKSADDLARLEEGAVVLSLSDPRHHAENLARATLGYVSASTIRPARPYVDPVVLAAVDFSLTKRILRSADGSALDYFFDHLWKPAVHEQPSLRDMCHEVEAIERNGVLTRVLLAEFLELGRRHFGSYPQEEDQRATQEFLHRLFRIVDKSDAEDLGDDLYFSVGSIRVGVVLVADSERAKQGVGPYLWRCNDDIKRGCMSLYLLARGKRNMKLLEDVIGRLSSHGRVLDIERSDYRLQTRFGMVNVAIARVSVEQSQLVQRSTVREVAGSASRQQAG